MRIKSTLSAVLIAATLSFVLAPAALAAPTGPLATPTTSAGAKADWDAAGQQAEVLSERANAANEALARDTAIAQADTAALQTATANLDAATQLMQAAKQTVAFAHAELARINAEIVADQRALNAIAASAYTGGAPSGLQNLMSAGTPQDYLDGQQMLAGVAAKNAQSMAKAKQDQAQQIATVASVTVADSIATASQAAAAAEQRTAAAAKSKADAATATAKSAQQQATASKLAMDAQVIKFHALFDKLSAKEKADAVAAKAKAAATAKAAASAFAAQQAALTLAAGSAQLPTLTVLQSAVARQIAGVAVARHLGERGVLIGMMTGLAESGLADLPYGDSATSSSLGAFQQIRTWGTPAQRLNAGTAAGLFYDRLVHVPNWASIDPWVAAQTVQQSEFRDGSNYRSKLTQAQLITTAILTALAQPAAPIGIGVRSSIIGSFVAPAAPTPQAQLAVNFALAQVGKPYIWAATGPDAFDCSGLTQAAWAQAGIGIPRVSYEQATLQLVPMDQLQPGDLVTAYSPVSHVTIYVGNGMIVSASDPEIGIVLEPVAQAGPAGTLTGHRVLVG